MGKRLCDYTEKNRNINNLGVTAERTTVLARVLAAVSDRSPGKLNTPES